MKKIFADAGYWIALFNPHHYASFGSHFRQGAVKVVKNLQKNTQIEIVAQTSDQFETALALYAQRLDKSWGLSDCISFQIMQSQGIAEAFSLR